jgi:hypothetical protein
MQLIIAATHQIKILFFHPISYHMIFHPTSDYISFHLISVNIQSAYNLVVYHGSSQQQIEIPSNAYKSSSLMHAAAAKCIHAAAVAKCTHV